MGFTKPGAQTSDTIKMVVKEITTFSSKDFLILWAGANDISKNNTTGALKSLTKFMKIYKRANIVLINTPHRHDLLSTSCVNKEVVKFNMQLKKIIKLNTNVDLTEAELQRRHFTTHGQHLNYSGKELVSFELAKKIEQKLTKVETTPIQIQWIEDTSYEGNSVIQNNIVDPVGSANYDNHVKSKQFQDGKKGELVKYH
jgi:hypothetical protein